MKTARLKGIVILILTLLNVFLLSLLLSRQIQQSRAHRRSAEQLQQLFAASSLTFDSKILPAESGMESCSVAADPSVQAAFAAELLGEASAEESGSTVSYEGEGGSCRFRTGGTLEAEVNALPVGEPLAFCEKLLKDYGYAVLASDRAEAEAVSKSGGGTITATRCTENGALFNVTLSFTFSGSRLTAVTGLLLPAVNPTGACDGISAVTAMVDFLDYYNAGGLVCTEVTGLQRGYLLQGLAAAQPKLVPVWYIETDVSSYYVDYVSGEVSRA